MNWPTKSKEDGFRPIDWADLSFTSSHSNNESMSVDSCMSSSNFGEFVGKLPAKSSLRRANGMRLGIVDNSLDSLVKCTQEEVKKFFKKKQLPNYKIRHRIKATKKPLVIQTSAVVYTNGMSFG
jgi:hypothetical protein